MNHSILVFAETPLKNHNADMKQMVSVDIARESARGPDLSRDELRRIVDFLGYGSEAADIWFVGLEEGLGQTDGGDALINLKARGKFYPVMDLVDAHLRLIERGEVIDIQRRNSFTQVWTWMAKIVRAREGANDWQDLEKAKDFVRYGLGRATGNNFLTELSSIPSRRVNDKSWYKWFQGRIDDLDERLALRRKKLCQLLRTSQPSLVICYGSAGKNWNRFSELFDIDRWETMASGIQSAMCSKSRCLMLPFFGQGHMKGEIIEALLRSRLLSRKR
ncbi:MAG: hypothetical protein ACLQBA_16330 [Candidatus Binataceae bacterium]